MPGGGDVDFLSRVIHDWGDAEVVAVLARCRRAMADGGRLLLVERILPEKAPPSPAVQGHALSDLNMLVRTGGRERTEAEYAPLLAAAGLRLVRVVPAQAPWSVLEGMPA